MSCHACAGTARRLTLGCACGWAAGHTTPPIHPCLPGGCMYQWPGRSAATGSRKTPGTAGQSRTAGSLGPRSSDPSPGRSLRHLRQVASRCSVRIDGQKSSHSAEARQQRWWRQALSSSSHSAEAAQPHAANQRAQLPFLPAPSHHPVKQASPVQDGGCKPRRARGNGQWAVGSGGLGAGGPPRQECRQAVPCLPGPTLHQLSAHATSQRSSCTRDRDSGREAAQGGAVGRKGGACLWLAAVAFAHAGDAVGGDLAKLVHQAGSTRGATAINVSFPAIAQGVVAPGRLRGMVGKGWRLVGWSAACTEQQQGRSRARLAHSCTPHLGHTLATLAVLGCAVLGVFAGLAQVAGLAVQAPAIHIGLSKVLDTVCAVWDLQGCRVRQQACENHRITNAPLRRGLRSKPRHCLSSGTGV